MLKAKALKLVQDINEPETIFRGAVQKPTESNMVEDAHLERKRQKSP